MIGLSSSFAGNSDRTAICEKTDARELIARIANSIYLEEEDKLSEAEIKLFRQLGEIYFEYVSVENNRFILTISREEFVQKGLSEIFYDILQEDITNNNYGLDKHPFSEIDWGEAHRIEREEFLMRRRIESQELLREIYPIIINDTTGCNYNTPGWGESLGTVSFYTNRTWTVGTQTWSDAVTATACQREIFSGGVSDNLNADCRSNPDFPGDLFSWCAVVRFADVLCPYPWRVPTARDFIDLDMGMGGSGSNRDATTSDIATPQFVMDNFITRWGGALGGASHPSSGVLYLQDLGAYWSQSQDVGEADSSGFALHVSASGYVYPHSSGNKTFGFSVRCVR